MTDQAEPGDQPAHDLAAFDVSKRSPEQIALSFARWKEQRKRPQQGPETGRAGRPAHPRPVPAIARGAAQDFPPGFEDVTDRDSERGPAEKTRTIQYSAPFAALLAAGSEPTAAHRIWYPGTELPRLRRPHPSRRHPKATWVLTGAASVVAVAVMASGALLELSDWRSPAGPEPSAAQIHPLDIPMAEPFAATATAARAGDWKLRRTIDLALMKAAPIVAAVHPPVPVVQTASKAAAAPKSAPATQLQFVPKPFVPSAAPATASIPAAPAAAAGLDGDPRPDALVQRGHDTRNNTFGANNRVAASGGKPAGAGKSGNSVDPRSASSRSGGAATAGPSDSTSGGTGGDGEGDGSGAGGKTGGDSGGGASSGDSGGEAGDGDAGGGDTGGGGAGGSDTGGDAGGGETGDGDSAGGDSGSGDGEDGESGGIGGALGGIGNALGGALGGGTGNGGPDSEDKNKDKSD